MNTGERVVTILGFSTKDFREATILDCNFEVKQDALAPGRGELIPMPPRWELWYGREYLRGCDIVLHTDNDITGINLPVLTHLVLINEIVANRVAELWSSASSGHHLAAARSWIQRKCVNGNEVTWKPQNQLQRSFSVGDVEEIAQAAARAAITEMHEKLVVNYREIMRTPFPTDNFNLTHMMANITRRYQAERMQASEGATKKQAEVRKPPKRAPAET